MNPHFQDFKSCASANWATLPYYVVGKIRIELMTSGFSDQRSKPYVSYLPLFGLGGWTRTNSLVNPNHAFYQLKLHPDTVDISVTPNCCNQLRVASLTYMKDSNFLFLRTASVLTIH